MNNCTADFLNAASTSNASRGNFNARITIWLEDAGLPGRSALHAPGPIRLSGTSRSTDE